jgi:murein DD-endopeptidase MepM/ murein hydrolase activator NlpD
VASTPLAAAKPYNSNYATAARPSPVAVATAPTPSPVATGSLHPHPDPVGGSAKGWTAVGGSPVVVGQADDAETLSRRYGVPEAALLSANGLGSRSEVRPGAHIVIPVFNARGPEAHTAKADEEPRDKPKHVAKRDDSDDDADADKPKSADVSHKKHKADAKKDDDADADDDNSPKREKVAKAEKPKPSEKLAKAEKAEKPAKSEKVAEAVKPEPKAATKAEPKPEKLAVKAEKPAVAQAEAAKPQHKKPETDNTPTGDVAAAAPNGEGKPSDNGQFRWPARGRIIQGFKNGGNDGINIALPEGTSVRAAEDGKVAYAGSALKGYGNLVLIRHSNGFVTAYANNGELSVKSGETVKRGQVIAKSGQTGDVSSPQLHFELRKGQTPVDPTNYLAGL